MAKKLTVNSSQFAGKRQKQKIFFFLCYLLPACYLLSALSGCAPTYPKANFKEHVIRLCKKEYKLDVKVETVGKTIAIYIPLTNLLDFAFTLTQDAGEKINNVILSVSRVALSSDSNYEFYCVIAHDVKIPEIQIVIIKSVDDVKRYMLGDISRGEYSKRMLIDMKVSPQAQKERSIKEAFERMNVDKKWREGVMQDFFRSDPTTLGDIGYWNERFYIKDVSTPEFLAEEIGSRIRFAFRDDKKLDESVMLKSSKGSYVTSGDADRSFRIEISAESRNAGSFTSEELSDKIFASALAVSYDVIHGYKFRDFDHLVITTLSDGRSSRVTREDLESYKPKKTKIEDVMVFDTL